MRKKLLWGLLLSLPVSALAAQGFPPRLEVTPARITPGTPFVITLSGEFAAPECVLEPGQVEGSLAQAERAFLVRFAPMVEPGGCIPVISPQEEVTLLTPGERAFGVFRLPTDVLESLQAGENLMVAVVDPAGERVAEASLTVVQATGREALLPTSGIYWDPSLPGNGFALEVVEESSALVTAFSYNEQGEPSWWSAQGPLVGGVLEADFVSISGGFCLLCNASFLPLNSSLPPATRGALLPMAWIVRGEGKAFLSFGPQPGQAIPLVRFQLQPPPPEFRQPALAGEWVFVDLARDRTFAAIRFTHREEGAFGQFTAAADNGQVQVRCLQFHECEVALGTANYPLRRADLTPDRLSGPEFLGVRVR
jgi:hypothetical protein